MRHVNNEVFSTSSLAKRAKVARDYAEHGLDEYSEFGVGASLLIHFDSITLEEDGGYSVDFTDNEEVKNNRWMTYAGFNINLSGMEYKVHAEQMAIFQALLDIHRFDLKKYADVKGMVVATTEDDLSLCCGHCLQVTRTFVDHLNSNPDKVAYTAAAKSDNDGEKFEYDSHNLSELLGYTYAER